MNEELEVNQLFSTNVCSLSKPEFIETILPLFDEYVADTLKQRPVSDLYPVVMTSGMYNDTRAENFIRFISELSWEILNRQGYNMDLYLTNVVEIWGQQHFRTSGMDYHFHGKSSQLSGFYFLDVPENSSRVILYDPRPVKIYSNLPERNIQEVTSASTAINYTPKTGDFIITDSWLPHSFTKNMNHNPLKFIHFNIGVVPRADIVPHTHHSLDGPIIV